MELGKLIVINDALYLELDALEVSFSSVAGRKSG
jgi:hypothetical protein